jgi:hypothetical protein
MLVKHPFKLLITRLEKMVLKQYRLYRLAG